MALCIFPLRIQPQEYRQQDLGPIDKLAKAIVDIALLPIKLFAAITLMPLLIPLVILHSVTVIVINTFLMFSFISLSMLFLLTTSEIVFPIGFCLFLLISAISLNAMLKDIEGSFENIFREFNIL